MSPAASPSQDTDGAEELCLVPGCGSPSVRRLSLAEARKAFPGLPERGRRAPLCRDHYRQWKKATRKARELERAGW